jgi:hypothetical protein
MCLKSLYQIDETWRQFLWSLGEKNTLFPVKNSPTFVIKIASNEAIMITYSFVKNGTTIRMIMNTSKNSMRYARYLETGFSLPSVAITINVNKAASVIHPCNKLPESIDLFKCISSLKLVYFFIIDDFEVTKKGLLISFGHPKTVISAFPNHIINVNFCQVVILLLF